MRALELAMESSLATNADVLEELLSLDTPAERPRKMRRGGWHPHARYGDPNATGMARWRIPVHDQAWYMIRHADVYDEQSWAGKEFRNTYGVPKVIFDELVHETPTKHMHSCAAHRSSTRRSQPAGRKELGKD